VARDQGGRAQSVDSIVCGSGRWAILHVIACESGDSHNTDTDTNADTDANSRDVPVCYTITHSGLQGDVVILDWSQPPGTARLARSYSIILRDGDDDTILHISFIQYNN
jgi:hypothetical protein